MNEYTNKLNEILQSPRLKASSRSFVESILEQGKKKELSEKQISYVDKFYEECFPPEEILAIERDWETNFTDEMRDNVRIMGEYYRCHYSDSNFGKLSKDPSWIPSKETYEKSADSNWARRIIGNSKSEPKFKIGESCVLRDTAKNRSKYPKMTGSPMLILEIDQGVKREFNIYYKVIEMVKIDEQKSFEIRQDCVNVLKHKD